MSSTKLPESTAKGTYYPKIEIDISHQFQEPELGVRTTLAVHQTVQLLPNLG